MGPAPTDVQGQLYYAVLYEGLGHLRILVHMCVFSCSVVSTLCDSLWPCRLQPARLFCPWNFLGKNTWGRLPFPSPGDLPKDRTPISCIGRWTLYHCATWETQCVSMEVLKPITPWFSGTTVVHPTIYVKNAGTHQNSVQFARILIFRKIWNMKHVRMVAYLRGKGRGGRVGIKRKRSFERINKRGLVLPMITMCHELKRLINLTFCSRSLKNKTKLKYKLDK